MEDSPARASSHLDVEGCFNVRDAGGWPAADGRVMRTGALYRADDPVRLTERGRRSIAALGLRAVIDLRQRSQVERGPGFVDPDITHHIEVVDRVIDPDAPPTLERAHDIARLYDDMVERGKAPLLEAIDIVGEHIGAGPVLVHCAAGKDRTGLVVALVQAAVGVPLESIVEEYALSDEPARRRRAAMVANPLSDDPPVARTPPFLWTAPAEAMALFAQRAVELHGTLEAWPIGLGLAPTTVERLRAGLLAPAP